MPLLTANFWYKPVQDSDVVDLPTGFDSRILVPNPSLDMSKRNHFIARKLPLNPAEPIIAMMQLFDINRVGLPNASVRLCTSWHGAVAVTLIRDAAIEFSEVVLTGGYARPDGSVVFPEFRSLTVGLPVRKALVPAALLTRDWVLLGPVTSVQVITNVISSTFLSGMMSHPIVSIKSNVSIVGIGSQAMPKVQVNLVFRRKGV